MTFEISEYCRDRCWLIGGNNKVQVVGQYHIGMEVQSFINTTVIKAVNDNSRVLRIYEDKIHFGNGGSTKIILCIGINLPTAHRIFLILWSLNGAKLTFFLVIVLCINYFL